jgi:hypothetical protein
MKITDEQCEAAMDFLRDNADAAGQAKAERLYLDDYTKSLLAILMTERAMDSLGAQERYARAHPKFLQHLEGLKTAVAEDVRQQFLMEAAKVKIEVWRSLSARERAGLV